MSGFELAVRCATRSVDIDVQRRDELVADAVTVAGGAGIATKLAELVAVVALTLRLRARRATGDDPGRLVRQGLSIGAAIAFAAAACLLVSAVASAPRVHPTVVVAAAFAVAATGGAVWSRRLAVPLAGVTLLAIGATGLLDWHSAHVPVALAVVATVGVIVGEPAPVRRTAGLSAAAAVVLGLTLPGSVVPAVVAGTTLLLPALLLALGWADARYAVAAALLWFYRFVALDPRAMTAALAARLLLMASAVALATLVSRHVIRRAASA